MRVGVLSDIHGNLPALDAVLAEVPPTGVDALVLTGDVAAGPLPVETIDRLAGLPWPVHWIRGNGERAMVTAFDSDGPLAEDETGDGWAGRQLTESQRDLLAGAPLSVTLDVDGLGEVLFCHGSPRRDDEILLVDSPPAVFAEALAGVRPATVVCGHTHMPFDRLAAGHRVVNPGSVGMAYGPPGAYWAVLGPTVELRRTPFDAEAAAAQITGRSSSPVASEFAQNYVLNPPDADAALAAFTERAAGTRPSGSAERGHR